MNIISRYLPALFAFFVLTFSAFSQSLEQNRPTPVRTGALRGEILPRDLGDARLTAYFYTFEAENGDLEITFSSKNLEGDIDIFEADNLRPIGKIKVFSDEETQIKKNFYFRQNTRVILRVEGRTPNDEKAEFSFWFGGTFAASKLPDVNENDLPALKTPKVDENIGGTRVNSVGSIIEVVKPLTPPTQASKSSANSKIVADQRRRINSRSSQTANASDNENIRGIENKDLKNSNVNRNASRRRGNSANNSSKTENAERNSNSAQKADITPDSENAALNSTSEKGNPKNKTAASRNSRSTDSASVDKKSRTNEVSENQSVSSNKTTSETASNDSARIANTRVGIRRKSAGNRTQTTADSAALASIRLVIILKNGEILTRQMNEVRRVNVENAELVVEFVNEKVEKHSLHNVLRFSIEQ